jgi:hypothetical protein
MKKVITVIVGVILTLGAVKAQSINDLDDKYGYKDIRFDMNVDSLLPAIKAKGYLFNNSGETKQYTLTLPEYKSFAEFKCTALMDVYRKEGIIESITLYMTKANREEFKKLVIFFSSLYGEPTKEGSISDRAYWKGTRMSLIVDYSSGYYANVLQVLLFNDEGVEEYKNRLGLKYEDVKKDF